MRLILLATGFAMLAGPAWAIDGLHFGNVDPSRGLDAVAATLSEVKLYNSPKFSKIVSGTDAEGRHVVAGGGDDDKVEMMAVSWEGAVTPDDAGSMGEIEKNFGFLGLERTARDKCDAIYNDAAGMTCTQVDYGCADNWCPVTVISLMPGEQKSDGVTHLSWQAHP